MHRQDRTFARRAESARRLIQRHQNRWPSLAFAFFATAKRPGIVDPTRGAMGEGPLKNPEHLEQTEHPRAESCHRCRTCHSGLKTFFSCWVVKEKKVLEVPWQLWQLWIHGRCRSIKALTPMLIDST